MSGGQGLTMWAVLRSPESDFKECLWVVGCDKMVSLSSERRKRKRKELGRGTVQKGGGGRGKNLDVVDAAFASLSLNRWRSRQQTRKRG